MIVGGTVVTTSMSYSNCFAASLASITYSAATGFTADDSTGNTFVMSTATCSALPKGSFCSNSGPVQGIVATYLVDMMDFGLSGSGTVGTQFATCLNDGAGMLNIGGKIFFKMITSNSCTSSITSFTFDASANSLKVATSGGTSTFTSSLAGSCGALPNGQYCGSGSQNNIIVNVSGYTMSLYLAPLQTSSIACTGSSHETFLAGNLVFSSGFKISCVGTVQSMTFANGAFAMQIGSETFTSVSSGSCESLPSKPVCGSDTSSNAVKLYWPGILFGIGFVVQCNQTNFVPIGAVGGYILYLPGNQFSCYPFVYTINSLLGGGTQSVTLNYQVQYSSYPAYNTTITLGSDMCGIVPGGSYCVDGNNRGSATVVQSSSNFESMNIMLAPHDHSTQTSCELSPNDFVVIGNNVLTSYPLSCSYGTVNLTYSSSSSTLSAAYLPSNIQNPSPSMFPMTLGSCLVIPAATYCGSAGGTGNVVVMAVNGSFFTLLIAIDGSVIGPVYGQLAVAAQGDIIMSFVSNNFFNVTSATFNGGAITLSISNQNIGFGNVQLYIGACGAIPAGEYCGSSLTLSASAVANGLFLNVSIMQYNGGASDICNLLYIAVSVGGTFLALSQGGNCFGTIQSVTWLASTSSLVLQPLSKPNLVLSQSLCGAVPSGFYCGRAPYPVSDTEAVIEVTGTGRMIMWLYSNSKRQVLSWPTSLLWQHTVVIDYRDPGGFYSTVKSLTYSDGALTLSATPSFSQVSFSDLVLQTGSCKWLSLASPSSVLGFTQTSLAISSSTFSMSSPFCGVAAISFAAVVALEDGQVQFLVDPESESSSGSNEPPCVAQGVYGDPIFIYSEKSTGTVVFATTVLNFPGTWVLGPGSATGGNGAPPTPQEGGTAASNTSQSATVAIGFTALGALVVVVLVFFAWKKFSTMTPTPSAAAPSDKRYSGNDIEEPMIRASAPAPLIREAEGHAAESSIQNAGEAA